MVPQQHWDIQNIRTDITGALGHPDDLAQHGTTIALGHPESSSHRVSVRLPARHEWDSHTFMEVGQNIVHTQKSKGYLKRGHPDFGTSRTRAWLVAQLDKRLGRPDLGPPNDIDDVNGEIYNISVSLGDTGRIVTKLTK